MDLGDWWEHEMNAAIPLGGIVMKRTFSKELISTVDRVLKNSIEYAWDHYPELTSFVKDNSQEMEEQVMQQHIELYVNEYTTDLGDSGRHAIQTLFSRAQEAGLVDDTGLQSIFY